MWKYLRFGYLHWIWILGTVAGLLAGGPWMWWGVAFVFVVGVGGEILSRHLVDDSNPDYRLPFIHDLLLYSVAIGLYFATFVLVWTCSAADWFGFGAWVNGTLASAGLSFDVLQARGGNAWYDYLGGALSVGALLGVTGIASSHELTHRTANPFDLWVGRWIFALMFGTNFATEHVYGHHKELGNSAVDAVSPKRGVGFYEFLTTGQWRQWRGGLAIEKRRLRALGKPWLSLRNRVLQAYGRGALIVALVVAAGGWLALAWWFVAICFAKYILEGLNFFSHYGLPRGPGEKIGLRHTFSNHNPWSNHLLFNLGRHGAHHVYDRPYHELRHAPMPNAPFGYLTMTVVSWIPPLFWRVMVPMLKDWDARWATAEERALAMQQNRESGVAALMEQTPPPGGASVFTA